MVFLHTLFSLNLRAGREHTGKRVILKLPLTKASSRQWEAEGGYGTFIPCSLLVQVIDNRPFSQAASCLLEWHPKPEPTGCVLYLESCESCKGLSARHLLKLSETLLLSLTV